MRHLTEEKVDQILEAAGLIMEKIMLFVTKLRHLDNPWSLETYKKCWWLSSAGENTTRKDCRLKM